MKIIELLNKIANEEDIPKKIYCFNKEFYLKGNTYFGDTFTLMHYIQEEDLNYEVEILEEEKKIPENNFNYIYSCEDEHIMANFENIKTTLKDIIDYLKSKGE